ncbi:MAG TPA: response regulator transcription factor [Solirubrobacterales bacterium]|nr:response regulator transcription factor [Solirubrobacterales bacterium]
MRALIVEDLALLRDGLERVLAAHGFEVATAPDADAFRDELDSGGPPDVCIVDVRLPPTFTDEGIRAALAARERHPGLPILVLSQYVERTYARELLAQGASAVGYLLKDRVADVGDFVDAVRRVAGGGTALDPDAVRQLVGGREDAGPLGELTGREREVLELVAEGRSNAGIATALGISVSAVEKQVSRVFEKLGLAESEHDHRRVLAVLAWLGEA